MILAIRTFEDVQRLRATVRTQFESDLVETLIAHHYKYLAPLELIYQTAKTLIAEVDRNYLFEPEKMFIEPGRLFLWKAKSEPSPTGKEKTPVSGISTGSISTTPTQQGPNSDSINSQGGGNDEDRRTQSKDRR